MNKERMDAIRRSLRVYDNRVAERDVIELLKAVEALTVQRDVAIKHIAEWCVAIDVVGTGWDDWDEYYKDAFYRENKLPEIRELLTEACETASIDRCGKCD